MVLQRDRSVNVLGSGKPQSTVSVKISGTFRHVKTRSMPQQLKPYKLMAELVRTQPTFDFENVRGTMVGFGVLFRCVVCH
jgi:alpha-acetolactate decarboxylase